MSATLTLAMVEHGTIDGYRAGCHGSRNSCGAKVSCLEVHTRYQGDWGFRRRVNSGESPAAIVAAELTEVEAVRARDKAAAAALKRESAVKHRAIVARKTAVKKPPKERAPQNPLLVDRIGDDVKRLHAEKFSDVAIARELDEPVASVHYIRYQVLGLPRNVRAKASGVPSARELRNEQVRSLIADKKTDREVAAVLGVSTSAAGQIRRRLGLPINSETSDRVVGVEHSEHRPEIARLHNENLSDGEIAERLGISQSWVNTIRRDMKLPVIRSPRTRWDGVQLAGHGTNASYARGCRCEPCKEARRAYQREYTKNRKAEGAQEYHGTAYGYQLGCRGRSACPGELSCTDAMLTQERERRRAAGIPPKELVDAKPMQAHVADLVNAGMSLARIGETSGVGIEVLRKMVHSRGKERGVVRQVLAERAAAVLAVPLKDAA